MKKGRMVKCSNEGCERRARVMGGGTEYTCPPSSGCPFVPKAARSFGQPKQKKSGGKKGKKK